MFWSKKKIILVASIYREYISEIEKRETNRINVVIENAIA